MVAIKIDSHARGLMAQMEGWMMGSLVSCMYNTS